MLLGRATVMLAEGEKGLDIAEEFYTDEIKHLEQVHDPAPIQDIQKGLQQSIQALN